MSTSPGAFTFKSGLNRYTFCLIELFVSLPLTPDPQEASNASVRPENPEYCLFLRCDLVRLVAHSSSSQPRSPLRPYNNLVRRVFCNKRSSSLYVEFQLALRVLLIPRHAQRSDLPWIEYPDRKRIRHCFVVYILL